MIVLRVLSYNGSPADGPSAQFDELGGTIGRADNNQLVLPDPERTISRVHARVVFRAGGYAVVDNGSNPISVNGQVIGTGREHPLKVGDELMIGGYLLAAEAPGALKSDDPFADLFGDAPLGLAAPAAPAAPRTAPGVAQRTAMPSAGAWPAPAPVTAPPPPVWAPAPSAAWPPPPPPRSPAVSAAAIPDDWDPFAPDPAEPPAPAAGRSTPADAFASLPAGGGDSLDDLFGLSGAPLSGDPLGGAPQQALMAQPNTAQHDDALQSLARTATLMPASRSDHASELNLPMSLPPVQAPPAHLAPAPLPQGAIFSWNDPPRDGRVVTLPGLRRPDAPPPLKRAEPALVSAPAAAAASRPEAARSLPAAGGPGPATAGAADAELLQALLRGLGVPGLRLDALTPQTMELVGQLLRESTRGAVELLVARAALKREMRAEMTMIVSRENNPLKFSPTVEVALQHLLGPPAPGFMPSATAMRDAFDDLRAHQLGVMAGMRAALEGVLQRFDPKQLEGKLSKRSAIDSIIPATRKARLWEAFNELFAQLQTEAQDDFDEIFGKAFLKAYEDQLDRLHNEAGPR
ncbi:type VI secretion system-associated FHA domain protein TagH [Rubrivivax rivuli]|uniref:Type VI secretion system-associated FHA domain protein TagH n=1 Tax=Rubrivivax rivuli TaxID=1862385 RepID=A0A437RDZ3_9BURK|nr:type VI secretion system-associated FHA domain protein TagH [Rubrivivax rivuli]RVU44980.1 type VI secretion system-associated FHA domain protein TagH [Rubrivivax rivuli]